MFLKFPKNSQENKGKRVFFLIRLQACCNVIKKENLVQAFSCGFAKFPQTFLTEHLKTTASATFNSNAAAQLSSFSKYSTLT